MTAVAAERLEPGELGTVPVEDRGAARHQKRCEEMLLGSAVMRHIAVVIEVIACQVGKSRSSNRHAVEPELIEAVARGFDRHMLDPLPRQIRARG